MSDKRVRPTGQRALQKVYAVMKDGEPRTATEISVLAGVPQHHASGGMSMLRESGEAHVFDWIYPEKGGGIRIWIFGPGVDKPKREPLSKTQRWRLSVERAKAAQPQETRDPKAPFTPFRHWMDAALFGEVDQVEPKIGAGRVHSLWAGITDELEAA